MSQHLASARRLAKAVKCALITEAEAIARLVREGMRQADAQHAIQAALQS